MFCQYDRWVWHKKFLEDLRNTGSVFKLLHLKKKIYCYYCSKEVENIYSNKI